MVIKMPHDQTRLISRPSNTNRVAPADSADRMDRICCATTDNTSMLIRLNSSKQPHAPVYRHRKRRELVWQNAEEITMLRWRNLKTKLSIWKSIKCFPATIRKRNLKKQQSLVTLELFLIITNSSFCKSYVFKHFPAKQVFSNSSAFNRNFRKASFSWRISVNGRPNCRNKAAFSIFSGVVRTGL